MTIGVGERRGAGSGVKAGRTADAVGRVAGVSVSTVCEPDVAVDCGVAGPGVATGAVAAASGDVICPVSNIRATFSLLTSNSMLPFGGGGGGAICLPLTRI